jgi:hypothetical protein
MRSRSCGGAAAGTVGRPVSEHFGVDAPRRQCKVEILKNQRSPTFAKDNASVQLVLWPRGAVRFVVVAEVPLNDDPGNDEQPCVGARS